MKTKKLVLAAALLALGVILPQIFHVFGQAAGTTFLPMHISILLAGLLLGPVYGLLLGALTPVLSFLIVSMPPVPKLYFMIFELIGYGFFAGILPKKTNVYLKLIFAMVFGRLCYALSLIIGANLFNVNAPFITTAAFFSSITTGIPGILIQIIFIPIIINVLYKTKLGDNL